MNESQPQRGLSREYIQLSRHVLKTDEHLHHIVETQVYASMRMKSPKIDIQYGVSIPGLLVAPSPETYTNMNGKERPLKAFAAARG